MEDRKTVDHTHPLMIMMLGIKPTKHTLILSIPLLDQNEETNMK